MKEAKKIPFLKNRKFWVLTVIVFGVLYFFYHKISSSKQNGVTSTQVKKGTVEEVLTLSGNINADKYAQLTFPINGEIAWVGVSEGDEVKRGQALTKLDTTVLNSVYQQTNATLRAAEATVEDIHDQVKDHSGDETFAQKDARTSAEAAKDRAYEAYIQAQYNLRNSTITAPFAGIVTYLAHTFSGVNVMPTETQIEVLDPKTMYFDVSADQSEVLQLYSGQEVEISLDTVTGEPLKGKVVFIGYTPKPNEVGTIYKVKVAFDDQNMDIKKYRIGLSGDANFITSQKDNVLYVPPNFIKSDSTGKYLSKSRSNGKTYIEIGLEGEDRTEIVSDKVKEGDIIFD